MIRKRVLMMHCKKRNGFEFLISAVVWHVGSMGTEAI